MCGAVCVLQCVLQGVLMICGCHYIPMFTLKVTLPGLYRLNVSCNVCVAVCVAECVLQCVCCSVCAAVCVDDSWLPLHTFIYVTVYVEV